MGFLEERFSVNIPVLNAGMGVGMAGPALVSAVSEAGGFGVLGAGGLTATEIEREVSTTKQLTNRPFGANLILPLCTNGDEVDAALRSKVSMLVLFWGDPGPYVADAQKAGIPLVAQCGDVDEAAHAASVGVDAVIIQGVEAGGHVKATVPLLNNLSEAVKELGEFPVIAAGGIATGAHIAGALSLGACGVSMGTLFVATNECRVLDSYKQRLVQSQASDTVLTSLFDVMWPDAPHRVFRNHRYRQWEATGCAPTGSREGEGEKVGLVKRGDMIIELPRYSMYPATIGFEGDIEETAVYFGECCGQVNSIIPATSVIEKLKKELNEATLGDQSKATTHR
jgi:NAD(P)H-dependent flavin oxidoreductase YrpB (nitropropane dioxygenase family)